VINAAIVHMDSSFRLRDKPGLSKPECPNEPVGSE
jgi:hypothetical protein